MNKKMLKAPLFVVPILLGVISANRVAYAAKAKTTTTTVVLKARNSGDLTNRVLDVTDPNSPLYHQYLSTDQFKQNYGQSNATVNKFQKYFKKYHLSSKAINSNLVLTVTGTRSNLIKAFKAKNAKHRSYTYTKTSLPKSLSSQTLTVIGLQGPKGKTSGKFTTHVQPTDQKPNINQSATTFSKKYGAKKFTDRYNLTNMINNGADGSGQSVGLIALSSYRKPDVSRYLKQNGLSGDTSRIHNHYVYSSAAAMNKIYSRRVSTDRYIGQLEVSLDVEQSSSVAPKANIDVYIGDSVNDNITGNAALYTTFAKAINDNIDKQISTSFGAGTEGLKYVAGESGTTRQYNNAFNQLLKQAALQGISVFNAAGDHGPYDINSLSGKEQHDFPTGSPYVTDVGGTTLPYESVVSGKLINVQQERAWGDTYSLDGLELKAGMFAGGGGGFSTLNPLPGYQAGVSGVGTFRAIKLLSYKDGRFVLNHDPQMITGKRSGRNMPDVSANSDIRTGYATVATFTNKKGKNKTTWMVDGGTSFASPQIAAANADLNSKLSQPVGFWNPQIYRFAVQPDTPFNVLDSDKNNNNLYYTGQPGKLYNQATGLGTINFDKLYQKFDNQ
ncbi:protease pro-enzyme activation domain-containing protein [Lentilactobacillus sp. SPB1-3]|uniref:Protease pro-enzyme activation domain-containing protein n=1 Tax=Lentilactobacillus terminaliae TaxID=3003483 RepID=A0ACD5DE89_9LACO|nr:S53 family peptidase [Lentilactobacillus sp. SPB1-3]MCZ0977482.1 S53 family peptidase [Lentilactobacillus sp. SPB1-3]